MKKNQAKGIEIFGEFRLVQVRNGLVLKDTIIPNAIVAQGKISLLNKFWRGAAFGPTNATWDFGFMSTINPTLVVGDTIQSHAGWTVGNFSTPSTTTFTGGTNGFNAVATQSITSFNTGIFGTPVTITTAGTIGGLFLTSTPSGPIGTSATDVLWSTASLTGANLTVNVGDVVYVSYKCSVGTAVAGVVNQGKDRLLDTMFNNNVYTWQADMFTGGLAALTDTLSTMTGWSNAGASASGAQTTTFEAATAAGTAASIFTAINTQPGVGFTTNAATINGIYVYDTTSTYLFANTRGNIATGGLVLLSNELIFFDYRIGIT